MPGLQLSDANHKHSNSHYDATSKEGLSSNSTGRTHKNIRFNSNMDEWGILVRL